MKKIVTEFVFTLLIVGTVFALFRHDRTRTHAEPNYFPVTELDANGNPDVAINNFMR